MRVGNVFPNQLPAPVKQCLREFQRRLDFGFLLADKFFESSQEHLSILNVTHQALVTAEAFKHLTALETRLRRQGLNYVSELFKCNAGAMDRVGVFWINAILELARAVKRPGNIAHEQKISLSRPAATLPAFDELTKRLNQFPQRLDAKVFGLLPGRFAQLRLPLFQEATKLLCRFKLLCQIAGGG